jgi:hypothetical protein
MVAQRPAEPSRAAIFRVCGLLLLAVVFGGCVTKSKANAQARAAYLAGQQEALMRMQRSQPQSQGPIVTFNGDVRNPVVAWTEGLTLARAFLAAGYYGAGDPAQIYIVRNGMATRVDPSQLLAGVDILLRPGDMVRLMAPTATPAKQQ